MQRIRVFSALVVLAACAPDGVITPPPTGEAVSNQGQSHSAYIVQLVPNANPTAVAASVGASPRFVYTNAMTGFSAELPAAAIEALQRNPLVQRIEPDGLAYPTAVSSWGLDRIDQRQLPLDGNYSPPNTGAGVRVYIIDSGILFTHTAFGGRAVPGLDLIGDGLNGGDCLGHGTHVSGTVGGANYGVAPGVQLISVRVFGCNGSTPWEVVLAAVDWVTGNRILPAVANMSLGGGYSQIVNDAVAGSIASGVVYTVSSGNASTDACTESPASVLTALTVNASQANDLRSGFSNGGPCSDLFAPGTSIVSAWIGHDNATASLSGTSMAAPHVAGAAAQLLSGNPALSPAEVSAALVTQATPGLIQDTPVPGTPNLLLYVTTIAPPPPPPPPSPPSPCKQRGKSHICK